MAIDDIVARIAADAESEAAEIVAQAEAVQWPLRYAIVHWAVLVPGLSAGNYDLFCRTVDGNGLAQPMPRPLPRTGFNEIQRVPLAVKS